MSANIQAVNLLYIKLNGSPLASDWVADLEDMYIDMALGAPDMVTLRFVDPLLKRLKTPAPFELGAALEISLPADTGNVVVTKVEVAAIEPEVRADGNSTFQVRAYNKMARLHFMRKTRSFLSLKDSDIVSQIAGEAGLSATVEATDEQYKYLVQWNQTNLEFILDRANRIGYQVYVDDTKIYFQPAGTLRTSASDAGILGYADNLSKFEPRLSPMRQMKKVIVHGWNPATKQSIAATAQSPSSTDYMGGISGNGGSKLQSAFGTQSETALFDEYVVSQTEATAIAQGILDQLNREWIEIEGTAMLSPKIKPATKVTVQNVPGGFNGDYFVTAVRHTWNVEGGSTSFTVSGRISPGVSGLLGGAGMGPRVYGVWPAVVTNNNDPDNLGRVKVKYPFMPQNNGADLESFWVRIATPMTGPSMGLQILPEINDEVLIAFGGGNPNDPYIIGFLWNGVDKPPLTSSQAVSSGKVIQRQFKTPAGHIVLFQDKQNDELIKITDKDGQFIEMVSKAGSQKITIKANKDMDITVGGNLKIDVTGNIDIKSTGNTAIKATGTGAFEATQAMSIKGLSLAMQANTTAELKANASLSLSSSGMAELKGSLVKIN